MGKALSPLTTEMQARWQWRWLGKPESSRLSVVGLLCLSIVGTVHSTVGTWHFPLLTDDHRHVLGVTLLSNSVRPATLLLALYQLRGQFAMLKEIAGIFAANCPWSQLS